jgi:hypothetical protein
LNGRDDGTGLKLFVRHALKSTEREYEKLRDLFRFKASKRRCNLYVKNFPINYEKEDIVNLFK